MPKDEMEYKRMGVVVLLSPVSCITHEDRFADVRWVSTKVPEIDEVDLDDRYRLSGTFEEK